MTDTIYWGIKLELASVAELLSHFPPKHSQLYAEHMTVAFRPHLKTDERLNLRKGEEVTLIVVGHVANEYGQAVAVEGFERVNPGTPHITISCAEGVSPVYSNTLFGRGFEPLSPGLRLELPGVLARFTKSGWDL